jgi:hypothetical protein
MAVLPSSSHETYEGYEREIFANKTNSPSVFALLMESSHLLACPLNPLGAP